MANREKSSAELILWPAIGVVVALGALAIGADLLPHAFFHAPH